MSEQQINKNENQKRSYAIFPKQLERIRATSVQYMKDCPKTWAANMLLANDNVAFVSEVFSESLKNKSFEEIQSIIDQIPATSNKEIIVVENTRDSAAAAIGTAMHAVIEDYANNKCLQAETNVNMQFIPGDSEKNNVVEYIKEQIAPIKHAIIALEHEFSINWKPGAPPLVGHIDMIYQENADTVVIVDHKSNRSYEGADIWASKMQQRVYGHAIRLLLPHYKYVKFKIGYINLGLSVEWITDPDDSVHLIKELSYLWDNITQKYVSNHPLDIHKYPEKYGEHCRWCVIKQYCKTFNNAKSEFDSSIQVLFNKDNTGGLSKEDQVLIDTYEEYARLKVIKKNIEKLIEEEEEKIIATLEKIKDKSKTVSGYHISLQNNSTSAIRLKDMWNELLPLFQNNPDLLAAIISEDIITTKITGINKLVKQFPEIKSIIDKHRFENVSKNYTIKEKYLFK